MSSPVSPSPSSQVQPSPIPKHVEQEEGKKDTADEGLLSVNFNQDYGCFACGTETGFRIYNCDPFKETFRREFNNQGIWLVEMLFRCNILAIVGGGKDPRYPPNKVMIWDDHQNRCIGELSFKSEVRAVRLRRDRIVVVLEHKIYVYNFSDLKLLHHIDTLSNPKGLCAVSPTSNRTVLACPGQRPGYVRVELYDTKRTTNISAHDSPLACFALTLDGSCLATASSKGTLIRVFKTDDGTKLQELRRGADRAEILSIAFAPTGQWLALSSDKGTVHVFAVKGTAALDVAKALEGAGALLAPFTGGSVAAPPNSGEPTIAPLSPGSNPGSSLSFLKGVLPKYFSSEWSFAQYRLPDETKAMVAFGQQKNTVIVIGNDGSFHKCAFDPVHGGEMIRQEYTLFMRKSARSDDDS